MSANADRHAEVSPRPRLRERKKARTKSLIQREALRLFSQQGYQATTMEKIAEAAEVAPSTVFRYFPTKEDLTLLDDYHALGDTIARALADQPREMPPVGAVRAAIGAVFAALSDDERAARYERDLLMVQIPELWAANLALITKGRRQLGASIAERVGRDPRDPQVTTLVDAVVGVGIGVLLDWADAPTDDPAAALDDALGRLEGHFSSWDRA